MRPEGGEGRCGRRRRKEGDRRFFLPFFSSERRNLTTFIRGPLSPPLWGQERKKLLEWDRPRRGQELGRKTRNWPAAVERGKRDIKQAEEKSGVLFAAFGRRGFVGLWGGSAERPLCASFLPSPPSPFLPDHLSTHHNQPSHRALSPPHPSFPLSPASLLSSSHSWRFVFFANRKEEEEEEERRRWI